jgi:hypothetical protein
MSIGSGGGFQTGALTANILAFLRGIVNSYLMRVPETTSAEAFERYVGGKCLRVGRGEAWRDLKAWIIAD